MKKTPYVEDRELMEVHLKFEETIHSLDQIKKGLSNSPLKKIYFNLFFGSSLSRLINQLKSSHSKIEGIIYPDINKDLSGEQIEHLLKVYDGIPIED